MTAGWACSVCVCVWCARLSLPAVSDAHLEAALCVPDPASSHEHDQKMKPLHPSGHTPCHTTLKQCSQRTVKTVVTPHSCARARRASERRYPPSHATLACTPETPPHLCEQVAYGFSFCHGALLQVCPAAHSHPQWPLLALDHHPASDTTQSSTESRQQTAHHRASEGNPHQNEGHSLNSLC